MKRTIVEFGSLSCLFNKIIFYKHYNFGVINFFVRRSFVTKYQLLFFMLMPIIEYFCTQYAYYNISERTKNINVGLYMNFSRALEKKIYFKSWYGTFDK